MKPRNHSLFGTTTNGMGHLVMTASNGQSDQLEVEIWDPLAASNNPEGRKVMARTNVQQDTSRISHHYAVSLGLAQHPPTESQKRMMGWLHLAPQGDQPVHIPQRWVWLLVRPFGNGVAKKLAIMVGPKDANDGPLVLGLKALKELGILAIPGNGRAVPNTGGSRRMMDRGSRTATLSQSLHSGVRKVPSQSRRKHNVWETNLSPTTLPQSPSYYSSQYSDRNTGGSSVCSGSSTLLSNPVPFTTPHPQLTSSLVDLRYVEPDYNNVAPSEAMADTYGNRDCFSTMDTPSQTHHLPHPPDPNDLQSGMRVDLERGYTEYTLLTPWPNVWAK